MSEFSLPSSTTTPKKIHFLSLLLSDLFSFCSFILSHPLYFLYFIFLFPYFFKILSFLSPLFITTFLLLLVLLTVSPNLVLENLSSESKASFVIGTYQAVVEKLRAKVNEEAGNSKGVNQFEELEVYKIVFDTSNFDVRESQIEDYEPEVEKNCLESNEVKVISAHVSENSVAITRLECCELIVEEKTFGGFMQEKNNLEEFTKNKLEEFTIQKEKKEVKPLSDNSNKGEGQKKEEIFSRSGSKARTNALSDTKVSVNDDSIRENFWSMNSQKLEADSWSPFYDSNSKVSDNYQTMESNLGSFGSMRKEKEWRRTLACKLFEERHNADGGEGMDSLWETYESDSIKLQAKSKTKKEKKGSFNSYYDNDSEEEEEEESNAQLCCLQALKFSAGKMNLGMGRPNLVKISKALKGIGWLHNVTKHGKKGYH